MRRNATGYFFIVFILLICFNDSVFTKNRSILKSKQDGFLKINDEMKAFVDKNLSGVIGQKEKLLKLISSLNDETNLGFKYSNYKTMTAEETFKNRSGNCISYTAMFIVLARYAGLTAKFQEVSDFSDWTKKNDVMVFSKHMNAVVRIGDKNIEVDFRYQNENKFLHRKIVNDNRAIAHYYNNLGAEALMLKKFKLAETYFYKGISSDKKFSLVWSNLGVLYQHINRIELAERIYNIALRFDKSNHSAQLNLSNLYIKTGRIRKGKALQNRIRKYMKGNPYYHFNLGKIAYGKGEFYKAIKYYKSAVKRDRTIPEFYIQIGAAYFKLGNRKFAEKFIKKASKLAKTSRELELYKKKLNYIYVNIKKK